MGRKNKRYFKPRRLKALSELPFPEPERSVVKELVLMQQIDGALLKMTWNGVVSSLWYRRHDICEQTDGPVMTAVEYRKGRKRLARLAKKRKRQKKGFSYEKYINSPEWRQKRLDFKPFGAKCLSCSAKGSLDLHHITYENIGKEGPDDCVWVCRKCHKKIHLLTKKLSLMVATMKVCPALRRN